MRRFVLANEQQREFYFSRLMCDADVAVRNVRLVHKGSHLRWLPADSGLLHNCVYWTMLRNSAFHRPAQRAPVPQQS